MPMVTYLHAEEGLRSTMVPELDDLLLEVREATGGDWRVIERVENVRRHGFLWRKRSVLRSYQLLLGVGSGEFQVVNFWRPRSSEFLWSLNDLVAADLVMAYIYGVLSGANEPCGEKS